MVYLDLEDEMVELGYSADIISNWSTGLFEDRFDGYWFCLPDGQILPVYLLSESAAYATYTSPVLLNGEGTNLRFRHVYADDSIVLEGAWQGMGENGEVAREIVHLQKGDTIAPVYFCTNASTDAEEQFTGEDYTFESEPEIIWDLLPEGDYYYSFYITDLYGSSLLTDFVAFNIEDDQVYYYE